MTLSEIKREVRALKRKYAVALAVVRLRRAAQEFCDEWQAAREEKKPTPAPVETDQWFYRRGFRLKGYHSRVLLRAPSGPRRSHQPPRPRTRIPHHDLAKVDTGTGATRPNQYN